MQAVSYMSLITVQKNIPLLIINYIYTHRLPHNSTIHAVQPTAASCNSLHKIFPYK